LATVLQLNRDARMRRSNTLYRVIFIIAHKRTALKRQLKVSFKYGNVQ